MVQAMLAIRAVHRLHRLLEPQGQGLLLLLAAYLSRVQQQQLQVTSREAYCNA
jgi:hypothetical protein